jgi:hypothetical protein
MITPSPDTDGGPRCVSHSAQLRTLIQQHTTSLAKDEVIKAK